MLLPLTTQPDMLRIFRSCCLEFNRQDTELCSTDLLPHMHLLFEPVVCDFYGTFIEENQQGRTSNLGAVFFVGCSLQDIVNIPLSKYSLCSVITAPWWRLCWYGLFPGDTMHCISGRMY